jgi:ribosomal protein S18 acetylase RimI-like enzyme
MPGHVDLKGITFTENGAVDVAQLNALYRLIGWDRFDRRTDAETAEMLKVSRYYIAAETAHELIGFARVCGDPYVAQVLDVITHPAYRHRGIASRCMRGVVAHLERSRYVTVSLTHSSGLEDFYRRFGFQASWESVRTWTPRVETPADDVEGSPPDGRP